MTSTTHKYMNAPDGVYSMQANYPAGSYIPSADIPGGFSFYALGPDNFDLTDAKEATLSYSVYFEEDFDFNKGGKLPGLCEFCSITSGHGPQRARWEAIFLP